MVDRRAGLAFAIGAVVIAVLAALIFLGPSQFIVDDSKPCVSPAYGRPGGCLLPGP